MTERQSDSQQLTVHYWLLYILREGAVSDERSTHRVFPQCLPILPLSALYILCRLTITVGARVCTYTIVISPRLRVRKVNFIT